MRKQVIHNETELMESFRLGNEQSFLLIFNYLYPSLCFYALRFTRDQGASEDITEESFTKIWDRRESFQKFKVLKSYLYTTVRNASIDWSRKDKQFQDWKKEIAAAGIVSEKYALENLIEAETFREIYVALDSLPKQCQKIMKMIFFEGKNTREVADELGLSVSTVKTQKSRALLKLKKTLTHLLLSIILLN